MLRSPMRAPLKRLGATPTVFMRLAAIATALMLGACSSPDAGSGAPERTLLIPSWTFDGTEFHDDLAVLISGNAILKVGSADELRPHADAIKDLPDSTLLPGFIDLHVHLGAVGDYSGLPETGVTTVRDVGISKHALPLPAVEGLTALYAGPIITVPGGYPIPIHGRTVAAPIEGASEARAQVQELAELGASVIKIAVSDGRPRFNWPVLSPAEIEGIVEEAHSLGIPVTAHLSNRHDVAKALDAGVDEWAHMPCARIPSWLLKRSIDSDVAIVGTLHVHEGCPALLRNARRFLAAGGKMLYGSDMGNSGIPFGIDIHELGLMMRAGMTIEKVLSAATSVAGNHLGLEPLGDLIEGSPAELLVVPGDLREDLGGLEDPALVIANGKILDP